MAASHRLLLSCLVLCLLPGLVPASVEFPACDFLGSEPGFRCSSGECILMDWVCDGEAQCPHPDTSDEDIGCNLYPETGCKSWHGHMYVKCPSQNSDRPRCVRDISECDQENDVNSSSCSPGQFKCRIGGCLPKLLACDGNSDCEDGSDEVEGCRLFPDTAPCLSWAGEKYVPCRNTNITKKYSHTICTRPELADKDCRSCDEDGEWRCDNGRCIPYGKVQDGIKDCSDGSDEQQYFFRWWLALLLTLGLACSGVLLSFGCRLWNNRKHVFDCGLCGASRAREARKRKSDFDTLDTITVSIAMTDTVSRQESNLSSAYEEYAIMFDLVDIFERTENWKKMSLAHATEQKGQFIYAKIHQNTVLYKALYRYIEYRFASLSDLNRIYEQLLRWEKDFHSESQVDAVACWRLHLGSSITLESIARCTREPGIFEKLSQQMLPTKDYLRRKRKDLPSTVQNIVEKVYSLCNTIWYLFWPFLGASLFYFDIIKDCFLAMIFYFALADMTHKNYSSYPFESTVIFSLIASIIVAQMLFAVVSTRYSNHIFEWCNHKKYPWKKKVFRAICLVFSPLMPAFVLANHVHYLRVEYTAKRTLQTLDDSIDRLSRLEIFFELQKYRYRAQLYRRLYSFYRVINATTQSFTVIVCIVVTALVTSRPSREVQLIDGVEEKIKDFLNLTPTDTSFIETFTLARDIVIGGSVLYSGVMILSALYRYVKQCKNMNIILGGKISLLLYFFAHLIARLTVFIAMFTTAEADSDTNPAVPLESASIIGVVLWVAHVIAILVYKTWFVPNFPKCDWIEKMVHILANTVVVVPFMTWDVDVITERPSEAMPHGEVQCAAINGRRRPRSRAVGAQAGSFKERTSARSKKPMTLFRFPSVHEPLVKEVGDLNERITNLWWEKPSAKLTRADAVAKVSSSGVISSMGQESIGRAFDDLDRLKFINKMSLYHPQRTKREYFWLFVQHFVVSMFALLIEWLNGGTNTAKGLYISWDVRFFCYVLGIIFLLLYYKRYHPMRDLTTFSCCRIYKVIPVLCGCKEDLPLSAPPDEETIRYFLVGDKLNEVREEGDEKTLPEEKATKEMETQTSIIEIKEDQENRIIVTNATDLRDIQEEETQNMPEARVTI